MRSARFAVPRRAEDGQPVSSQRNDSDIAARLKSQVFVDGVGGHKNHLDVDSLLVVETFVICHVEGEETDARRLDAHADLFEGCLRIEICVQEKNR